MDEVQERTITCVGVICSALASIRDLDLSLVEQYLPRLFSAESFKSFVLEVPFSDIDPSPTKQNLFLLLRLLEVLKDLNITPTDENVQQVMKCLQVERTAAKRMDEEISCAITAYCLENVPESAFD